MCSYDRSPAGRLPSAIATGRDSVHPVDQVLQHGGLAEQKSGEDLTEVLACFHRQNRGIEIWGNPNMSIKTPPGTVVDLSQIPGRESVADIESRQRFDEGIPDRPLRGADGDVRRLSDIVEEGGDEDSIHPRGRPSKGLGILEREFHNLQRVIDQSIRPRVMVLLAGSKVHDVEHEPMKDMINNGVLASRADCYEKIPNIRDGLFPPRIGIENALDEVSGTKTRQLHSLPPYY